ncbi:imelysin family protein [Fluviicola taffensis]|uniref:Peptidase M75, Imelysin n=1 Tax=Fluviicola taffensis (strain DSM 16823 / NCIMB 13979 / RW262) TaxID=755732 RepID=F2IGX3_FLUTR|nr:imelysin family protein [Fluviicola taffensis]AEA44754.1 Peptidase M75, Imelysin [Fluviicola taffensis DSM 16823]
MKLVKWTIPFIALLVIAACKKKKDENTDFDKGPIMVNMADNYIIPGYVDLKTKIFDLESSWNDFLADKTQTKLDISKQAWADANISFQHVKGFDFGPAMTANLVLTFGTFPTDTAQINSNVQSGSYDLSTTQNLDASGFDALDYLLYKQDALTKFQTISSACSYVTNVIAKMKAEITLVVSGWDTYRATFVAGTSNESTSPFALLINNFCKDFELCKTTKLGFPIGNHTLGIQQPNYLEARRSGIGRTLLIENIRASRAIFYGLNLSGNTNGTGFDDYLNALENKASLSNTIASRFDYMLSTPQTWTETLEELMISSPTTLSNFYDYQQGSVINLKTDMASTFGVLITYQDTDGD